MAAVFQNDAAGFAAIEAEITELWNKIGVEQSQVNQILAVHNGAKSALKKSMDSKESMTFSKRPSEPILKATKDITTTVRLTKVPTGHQMEMFFKKFQIMFKNERRKFKEQLIETRMEGRNIVIQIKSPKAIDIIFKLTEEEEAPVKDEDKPHKFTIEGLEALACIRDIVARINIWSKNITDKMMKEMVKTFDVDGQKKGTIIVRILMLLSNIADEPDMFVEMDGASRMHVAQRAKEILPDPALLMAT